MKALLMLAICTLLVGCATAPVIEEQIVIEEPVSVFTPELTIVSATQGGVITKLSGAAFLRDVEDEDYFILRQGDTIPIGRIFYLAPKTTMKIEQQSGKEIFLYSKDHEAYFKLEINNP
jgi:hypothetical protein